MYAAAIFFGGPWGMVQSVFPVTGDIIGSSACSCYFLCYRFPQNVDKY